MKLKTIRFIATCMIVSVLCAGVLYQYTKAKKDTYSNAVFVKVTNHIKNRSTL